MVEHLFEDIFIVTRLDPDGKKFDKGNFVCLFRRMNFELCKWFAVSK